MYVSDKEIMGTIGGGALEYLAVSAARLMLATDAPSRQESIALGPEIGQCCGGRVTLSYQFKTPEPAIKRPTLIFGGGHVGAALCAALNAQRYPAEVFDSRPGYGTPTALPEAQIRSAPAGAAFVITTHDHALDFLLAEEALRRGDAAYVGMIGSQTKRATFEARLRKAGLEPGSLVCPIGATGRGDKRPELIALHTAAEIIQALDP